MSTFFSNLFGSSKKEIVDPMKKFLIVGLGNIGPKYTETRHNIGFKVVDAYAELKETSWTTEKLGDVASTKVKGKTVILLKPNTYMNLSGKSVNFWIMSSTMPFANRTPRKVDTKSVFVCPWISYLIKTNRNVKPQKSMERRTSENMASCLVGSLGLRTQRVR